MYVCIFYIIIYIIIYGPMGLGRMCVGRLVGGGGYCLVGWDGSQKYLESIPLKHGPRTQLIRLAHRMAGDLGDGLASPTSFRLARK